MPMRRAPRYGATLSRFDLGYGEEALALNQPMTIRAQGARVVVEGIDIALPRGGALVGDIDKYGNGMKGAIRLSDLDAGLAKRFAGAPILGGTVSADATFDTGGGRPMSPSPSTSCNSRAWIPATRCRWRQMPIGTGASRTHRASWWAISGSR